MQPLLQEDAIMPDRLIIEETAQGPGLIALAWIYGAILLILSFIFLVLFLRELRRKKPGP
jgi:hypothetical protein